MNRTKRGKGIDTIKLSRLMEEGKWTAALRVTERVRGNPDLSAWYHSCRGLILQKLGKAQAAMHAYEEALARDPSSWDAQFNSAVLLFEQGYHESAIERLEKCIEAGQHENLARITLAKIYVSREDPLSVFGTLPEVSNGSDYCHSVRRLRAAAFSIVGDQLSAISELSAVIETEAHSDDLTERARCLIYRGSFDAAEQDIRLALDLDSQNPEALFLLSHYFDIDTGELLEITSRIKSSDLSVGEKATLFFSEGQISMRRGRFDEAFKKFSMANDYLSKASRYGFAAQFRYLCSQSQMLLSESLKSVPNDSDSIIPVFILGMPRTGSSLLAARLGEFQDFGTIGESSILSRLYEANSHDVDPYISTAAATKIREQYLHWLGTAAPCKRFVIDKAPGNVFRLRSLLDIFPEALFLVTQRDSQETIWANFKQPFGKHLGFTYSLSDLVKVYRLHNQILADVAESNRVVQVELSEMAESPEAVLEGILERLGTDSSRAIKSADGEVSVRTASAKQVRDVRHSGRNEIALLPEQIRQTLAELSLEVQI